jgi:transposase
VFVLEYKAVVKSNQVKAIDEAIRTSQFVRNKVLRYWMDNRGVGKKELYQYNTQLRAEYKFVNDLNSHACQASVENVERAVKRFFDNCKAKKQGKKRHMLQAGKPVQRSGSAIHALKNIAVRLNTRSQGGSCTHQNDA